MFPSRCVISVAPAYMLEMVSTLSYQCVGDDLQ